MLKRSIQTIDQISEIKINVINLPDQTLWLVQGFCHLEHVLNEEIEEKYPFKDDGKILMQCASISKFPIIAE